MVNIFSSVCVQIRILTNNQYFFQLIINVHVESGAVMQNEFTTNGITIVEGCY